MRIQILGSAAAEAVPGVWCECDFCREVRIKGGKDIRRRTAYLIDDDTLVDFGPDSVWQSCEFKIDLTQIKRVLFSHSHSDHLCAQEFEWRNGYSRVSRNLKVFGNANVLALINQKATPQGACYTPIEVVGGNSYQDEDMTITAVTAQHYPGDGAVNYIVERNGRSILIANDTGWWDEESWNFVAGLHLDAAIIECTYAFLDVDHRAGHLGAKAAREFRDRLVEMGVLDAAAPALVNHFSHNGSPGQEALEEYYAPFKMGVGYDGLIINF